MMKPIQNERGIALMVSLMVLIMLTLIGMAAIMNTTTEINIASNQKQGTQSIYLAEAGVGIVKAFFEDPSLFENSDPVGGGVKCLDPGGGSLGTGNCGLGNHSTLNGHANWYEGFFDKRRQTADGARSYIREEMGVKYSQFLDTDNDLARDSNNEQDDDNIGNALDLNAGMDGWVPVLLMDQPGYLNTVLLGGGFLDVGDLLSIEIFPPFQADNYAVVRVRAKTGSSIRTIEQEIGPSVFIPITSGAQAGGAGSFNGNGSVHWGKVKVLGDLDNFNANNTNTNQVCEDAGCGEGDGFDPWLELRVGGSVLADQGNPDACVTDCANAELGVDREYENFDVYDNVAGLEIDMLDYGELKTYAQDTGNYYVVCVDNAGDDPPPDVGQNDAVFYKGNCDDPAPQTFSELTNTETFDLYFIDWEDTTGTNATAKGPGFTLKQTGNYWMDGNVYINGNVTWGGSGGGKDTVIEDPDGVNDTAGLSCVGLSDQATCEKSVNIDGLLYTTGSFGGTGSPTVYGALVAEGGLNSQGNPNIYYDANFADGIGNLPRTSRQIWREIR